MVTVVRDGNLFDCLEELENTLIAEAMGSGDCWLESVKVATAPPAVRNASAEREAASLLTHLLSDAATDAALRAKLVEVLRPLSDRLPADVVTDGVVDAADAPLVTMLRAGRYLHVRRSGRPNRRPGSANAFAGPGTTPQTGASPSPKSCRC
jgi:hypothetical protein